MKTDHPTLFEETADSQLLAFFLHTFLLNNSRDEDSINKILNNLVNNFTESDIEAMPLKRLNILAKSLRYLVLCSNLTDLEEYERMVYNICVEKNRKFADRVKEKEANGEYDEKRISKENIIIRDLLTDMGVHFEEEYNSEETLSSLDFYIPEARLAIEINGRNHYYPFSTRYNNFTNFKSKMLKSSGYQVFHLNSWKLEGMMNNPEGVKELLRKTIDTGKSRLAERKQQEQ